MVYTIAGLPALSRSALADRKADPDFCMTRAGMAGVLVSLAAGLGVNADAPRTATSAARVAELRDRFLMEDVARPMRARLGHEPLPREARRESRAPRDRVLSLQPVPFLLPYPLIGPSCVEQVCNLVGSLGCNTDRRILQVLGMCSGNLSGDCVRAACSQLISVECDTLDAIAPMVAACRSNYSGGCLETACNLLGSVQCQDQQALARILEACTGNFDGSCVAGVCARLGPVACTTMDEVFLVAQSCGAYRTY